MSLACSRLLLLVLLSTEDSLCLLIDPDLGRSWAIAGCLGSTAGGLAKLGVVSPGWLGGDVIAEGFELWIAVTSRGADSRRFFGILALLSSLGDSVCLLFFFAWSAGAISSSASSFAISSSSGPIFLFGVGVSIAS